MEKLENLSFLQGLGQLKDLSLSQVADADLSYLKSAKNLTGFFFLEGYHIRNPKVLSEAKNMERLFLFELESAYAKREEIQCLNSLKKLKELRIFGGNSSVLTEQAQRYLPELDYIWIDDELPYDYRIVIEQGMD